jgi:hypothetical protein
MYALNSFLFFFFSFSILNLLSVFARVFFLLPSSSFWLLGRNGGSTGGKASSGKLDAMANLYATSHEPGSEGGGGGGGEGGGSTTTFRRDRTNRPGKSHIDMAEVRKTRDPVFVLNSYVDQRADKLEFEKRRHHDL